MNNGYIRVEHLTKRYGDLVVLNEISLDVAEGEFLALLGPSGCGKTTLLRAIAGFVEFGDGDILIDGRSMKRLPPNRRPRLRCSARPLRTWEPRRSRSSSTLC